MPTWLQSALERLGAYVSNAFHIVWAWGVGVALALVGWLPDHEPMNLPDPAQFAAVFRGFGTFSRFIEIQHIFYVALLMMGFVMYRLFHGVIMKVRSLLRNLVWGG
jgi:hypothetical protein